MIKPDLKIYIILIIILGVLFILVLTVPFKKKKKTPLPYHPIITPPSSSPPFLRKIKSPPTLQPPTPTLIPPTSTGGNEEIPPEVINASQQRKNLEKRLPLKEKEFTINLFDYTEYKFIVNLNEPKEESKKIFEEWLKLNYPDLTIDDYFTFK